MQDVMKCIEVLNYNVKEPEDVYNLDELIEDYGSEEEAYEVIRSDYLSLYETKVKYDDVEIGYPEKLMTMNLWKLIKLHRFGFFEKDIRLTDDTILYECKGLDGVNDSIFYSFADSRQVAKIKEIKDNSLNCLRCNETWSKTLKRIYETLDNQGDYSVNIVINNLDNIIESILMALQSDNPLLFPNFELVIDIENSDKTYIYRGVVTYNGSISNFCKLNEMFFKGDFFYYFILRQFNGNSTINKDIMEYFGLNYNIEVAKINGKEVDIKQLKLVNGELKYDNIKDNQRYIQDFARQNHELIRDLMMECKKVSLGYIK